jgi:hypothetical protein
MDGARKYNEDKENIIRVEFQSGFRHTKMRNCREIEVVDMVRTMEM